MTVAWAPGALVSKASGPNSASSSGQMARCRSTSSRPRLARIQPTERASTGAKKKPSSHRRRAVTGDTRLGQEPRCQPGRTVAPGSGVFVTFTIRTPKTGPSAVPVLHRCAR